MAGKKQKMTRKWEKLTNMEEGQHGVDQTETKLDDCSVIFLSEARARRVEHVSMRRLASTQSKYNGQNQDSIFSVKRSLPPYHNSYPKKKTMIDHAHHCMVSQSVPSGVDQHHVQVVCHPTDHGITVASRQSATQPDLDCEQPAHPPHGVAERPKRH